MASLPLSKDDFQAVKSFFARGIFGKRNVLIFVLGTYTGFRISECLSLRIGDVMKYDGRINNRLTVDKSHMKGKKSSRTIIIHPNLKIYIDEYFKDWETLYGKHDIDVKFDIKDKKTPLFPSRKTIFDEKTNTHKVKPVSIRNISKLFEAAAKELKIENLSSHSMRKTFAKATYQAFDKEILKVQKAMGHKSINSTQCYLQNINNTEIEDGILKLDFE